ncbi:hypothetical protein [Pseudomonas chlororaphis]|uniref:hypothetical protein n=1 Tax=Pseudomonas chlororaphis TaxID=587753 RepID=UPI000471089A|nr:hypothetical protein [Pseudomonas chlororaphis]AVO56712.1 hypothetical protein C6Q18_01605 [Pseudomonas chlororaphis subsp. piscium]AZC28331.1 hypothetical protein C4K38_0340 [Pseudomonas chlororaphis subsp. piscium]MBP5074242.1 hypothetical protein [Pseudomonas chlororaphis]MBP5078587.1 hypothetical protein [Pseudomonas chlororaphis]UQS91009.1 hypothetical protein M5C90_06290 [Pseudomonas chlororaphis subsp. piscium]
MLDSYALSWISVFVLILLSLALWLYTSYTRMDEMLKHLSNCRAIQIRKPLMGKDPFGRLFMMGTIAGVLLTPKLYLKDGGADPDDIAKFPKHLKRVIAIQYGLLVLAGTSMFALWGVGKYMGWLK